MSNGVKLVFEADLDDKSLSGIENDLEEVFENFQKLATKLGESIPKQVGSAFDATYEDIGKNYKKLSTSLGIATQNAIADSIGPYFQGEMDKVEDIWHTAWDSMTVAAEKQFAKLMSDMVGNAAQMFYKIFQEAIFNPEKWFEKSVKGTLTDWGAKAKNWVVTALGGKSDSGGTNITAIPEAGYKDDNTTRKAYFLSTAYKVADNFTVFPEFTYFDYGDAPEQGKDRGREWVLGMLLRFAF